MTMVDHQAMVSVVQGRLLRVSGEPAFDPTQIDGLLRYYVRPVGAIASATDGTGSVADGGAVAFVSQRDAGAALVVVDLDAGAERILLERDARDTPAWHPSGQTLSVATRRDRQRGTRGTWRVGYGVTAVFTT